MMGPKPLSVIRRLLWLKVLSVALVFLFVSGQALSQAGSPLSGTVGTKGGKAVPCVTVVGSLWKECCPARRDSVRTDVNGDFRIQHPGAVLHFVKDGFEPETVVVKQGARHLRVILSPATSDWTIPTCGKSEHGFKKIGGKFGIRFLVPVRFVKVQGGKPDTDYVRYIIRLKKDYSYMEIWFGPYAIPTDPEDDLFVASTDFSQRNIGTTSANEPFVGVDSSGYLRSGGKWRWAAISGMSGAVYRDAHPQDSTVFDQIINSMCFAPWPKR